MPRSLADIRHDVRDWIAQSASTFHGEYVENGCIWVLKYIPARFLESFRRDSRLMVSTSPGFTWGDGVYVVPLCFPYSSMMYGRIGIMGWVNAHGMAVYDAAAPRGIELYQEWIRSRAYLYRLLTTTIHSDRVNRVLRNQFRREFGIGIVFFPPDQFNVSYVRPQRDRWFCISDWAGTGGFTPGQAPIPSDSVRECEWVAVVGEEFEKTGSQIFYRDLIGPHLRAGAPMSPAPIVSDLRTQYARSRAARGTGAPPPILILRP
jgi:hypothetical protein